MRSFPQRGGWFLLCRAQWVLCQFFLFLPVCLSQAGVLKQAGTASLGFMDERDTLCLSMPHSFFDCKPSKALLSTTLGKSQIRCRVFAISTKFLDIFLQHPIWLRGRIRSARAYTQKGAIHFWTAPSFLWRFTVRVSARKIGDTARHIRSRNCRIPHLPAPPLKSARPCSSLRRDMRSRARRSTPNRNPQSVSGLTEVHALPSCVCLLLHLFVSGVPFQNGFLPSYAAVFPRGSL